MCRVCMCVDMQVRMSVDTCLQVYLHAEVDNGWLPLSLSTWHDEAESELELADSSCSGYQLALGMPCLSASMVLELQRAAMPALRWRGSRDLNSDSHTCAPDTPSSYFARPCVLFWWLSLLIPYSLNKQATALRPRQWEETVLGVRGLESNINQQRFNKV